MVDPLRRFFAVLMILAAVLVLAMIRGRAPAPKPATAPASEFSAVRAARILETLVGDNRPHPVNSAANREVRDKIVARLTALGYRPEIQRRFVCRAYVSCATVENIVAVLPGTSNGKAVMLAVHYDSVPAGPGASDDGAGVAAVLEIARILRTEKHRNPIVILIDDGEEAGLLGAAAFLEHPVAKNVGVVVNLEARGTEGVSFMFETSAQNRWLISRMRSAVGRPAASSLYYSIYQRLPNDTDFTVFKAAGLAGVNFGFIGGATRYHTPRDDVAHASRASLQHHGDNALAMVRTLANSDIESIPTAESVYFDLLQFGILAWPSELTWPLVAVAAFLIAVAIGRMLRSDSLRLAPLFLGIIGWLGTFLGSLLLALALAYLLRKRGAFPSEWIAHPAAAMALFWIAGLVAAWLVPAFLGSRARFEGLWSGVAIGWLLLAVVVAAVLPGASYLFIPVALALGWPRATLLPTLVAAVIIVPTALPLYDAMGLTLLPVVTVIVAMVASLHAPLLAGASWRARAAVVSIAAGGMLIALGFALTRKPYSFDNPRRLNIAYRVDADRAAREWIIAADQALPESLRKAATWTIVKDESTGFESFVSAAAGPALPLPSLLVHESSPTENGRRVSLAVRPGREAPRVTLMLRANDRIESMRIGGVDVAAPLRLERRGVAPEWTRIALRVGEDEIPIELVMRDGDPIEGYLEEFSYGLPPEAATIVRARPAWAVPSQNGDTTIVTRRVRI